VWSIPSRKTWQCGAKGCGKQFSATSGTIFASRKRPIRDYLLAIAIFVNGAKGHSALQLSRDLDCQYKTAFVTALDFPTVVVDENDKDTFRREMREADILLHVLEPVTAAVIHAAPYLRLIQKIGIGGHGL
jgi:hypothetical protein